MKIEQTIGTVRERNLEKIGFFCDAKKEADIFVKIEIINRYINRTDYQKAFEGFTKTGETMRAALKSFLEFHRLMPIDSLFFRWVYYQTQKKKYNDKRKLNF